MIKWWYCGVTGMVFGIVVLGGVTRLTESGLSMVTWKPLGTLPPSTPEAWEEEFERYKAYPEFKILNREMTVEEFKRIFFFEYAHRMWGRAIGIAWALPLAYFALRGQLKGRMLQRSVAVLGGIGVQGLVGWWMVRSGLEEPEQYGVPRVSQYRLATHFAAALTLFGGLLWTTMDLFMPSHRALPDGSLLQKGADSAASAFRNLGHLRWAARGSAALVALTALSGAFVAGLDAGLIYNEFPKMGGDWVPQGAWDLSEIAKTSSDASPSPWGNWLRANLFENSPSVQFNHRTLGESTVLAITATYLLQRSRLGKSLPPRASTALKALVAMAYLQATLGITTLLTFVPVEIAASHQAGSLALLTTALWVLQELRRIR